LKTQNDISKGIETKCVLNLTWRRRGIKPKFAVSTQQSRVLADRIIGRHLELSSDGSADWKPAARWASSIADHAFVDTDITGTLGPLEEAVAAGAGDHRSAPAHAIGKKGHHATAFAEGTDPVGL
jgi:hypothetical protein